jgi:hypothetical protein
VLPCDTWRRQTGRSRAAVLVARAAVATNDPVLVVDAIDLITAAILHVAGVHGESAVQILMVLWGIDETGQTQPAGRGWCRRPSQA